MKIKFSKIAQLEYEEIIYYLYDNFGKEKATKFSDLLKQAKIYGKSLYYSNLLCE